MNEELFSRYLTDKLTPQEQEELTRLLRDDLSAREQFVQFALDWTLLGSVSRHLATMEESVVSRSELAEATADSGVAGESVFRPQPRRRLLFAPILAVAAGVLAVAGVWWWQTAGPGGRAGPGVRFPAPDSFATITKRIGDVRIAGNTITTGTGSYSRVDLDDRTILALDQNSAVSAARGRGTGATRVDHGKGRIYLDVTKQQRPFTIGSDTMEVEVVGTKVLTEQGKYVAVLDGEAVVRAAGMEVNATRGQFAVPKTMDEIDRARIVVRRLPILRDGLAWLSPLGVDTERVREAANRPVAAERQAPLDFENCTVRGGKWRIRWDGPRMHITQNDPDAQGEILFGEYKWVRGVASVSLRTTERRATGMALRVNIGCCFPTGNDMFGLSSMLEHPDFRDKWIRLRVPFEIGPNDTLAIRGMEAWAEDNPGQKGFWNFDKSPENSVFTGRKACAIGLYTCGCSAEFRDLTLTDAVAAPVERSSAARRVQDGLLALYRFDEGGGTVVRDASGAAEPLDLCIEKAGGGRWLPTGLQVDRATRVASGPTGKLREAWEKSGGITIDFWQVVGGSMTSGVRYAAARLEGEILSLNYTQIYHARRWNASTHTAVTYRKEGAEMVMRAYLEGELKNTQRFGSEMEKLMTDGPVRVVLPGGKVAKPGGDEVPWEGEYRLMRLYGRALSEEEIRRNYEAGPGRAGPLAVYRFREGTGTTIRDVSGAGEPLDLTIEKPEMVRWSGRGLEVDGDATITSGTATKLAEAWRASGGLSVEFWGKARSGMTPGARYSFLDLNWPQAGFHCAFSPLSDHLDEKIEHHVFTWVRQENGTAQRTYANGQAGRTVGRDFPGDWLANNPFVLRMPGAPRPDGKDTATRPWMGTYVEMTIHDHALTPEEVRRNYEAGPDRASKAQAAGR